jgi:3-isopropylmalate dehydrogenase
MSLVQRPKDLDVILTENMVGDTLFDQPGGVVGSLGLLASACIGGPGSCVQTGPRLRARHCRKGYCQSLGAILSAALLLRDSFRLEQEATCVENAVGAALNGGSAPPTSPMPDGVNLNPENGLPRRCSTPECD